jgi:hypothetical protein
MTSLRSECPAHMPPTFGQAVADKQASKQASKHNKKSTLNLEMGLNSVLHVRVHCHLQAQSIAAHACCTAQSIPNLAPRFEENLCTEPCAVADSNSSNINPNRWLLHAPAQTKRHKHRGDEAEHNANHTDSASAESYRPDPYTPSSDAPQATSPGRCRSRLGAVLGCDPAYQAERHQATRLRAPG